MLSSSPLAFTASSVWTNMIESLRFAPAVTQPSGRPFASTATDPFHPSYARSVEFGPVSSPP